MCTLLEKLVKKTQKSMEKWLKVVLCSNLACKRYHINSKFCLGPKSYSKTIKEKNIFCVTRLIVASVHTYVHFVLRRSKGFFILCCVVPEVCVILCCVVPEVSKFEILDKTLTENLKIF